MYSPSPARGDQPGADVAIEAQRFVLGEHEHAPQVGVNAIGKGDVDDAVQAAERNGRLGAVARQRPQPFALTSCEEHSDGVAHVDMDLTPGTAKERAKV